MQKQNKRGSSRQWRNANRKLDPTSRDFLVTLHEAIGRETFAGTYLCDQYLSKFNGEGTITATERRERAVRKWIDVEKGNHSANLRIRGRDRGYNILPRVSWYTFLASAQSHVERVLGPLSNKVLLGTFSSGASTSRRRVDASPASKYIGLADVTAASTTYVDLIHKETELLRQYGIFYHLREIPGAILFTVPKSTEIDRCACKEPDINMYLQKGVGAHIRSRLKSVSINLDDQSRNRSLARVGSIDGSLATLDLSSASDTVTRSCVEALLPRDWFLYLNDIRSQAVEVNGTYRETEMFSSMGNGFTFELESLLFWSLCKTTCYLRGHPGVISVYGDDIIVPSGAYDDVCWVLSEFGFRINPDKSFATGSFRESCGGHYHNGEDVTPFYLRREPTHISDAIRIGNQLRRWATADASRVYEYPQTWDLWQEIANLVPREFWGGSDLAVDTQLCSPSTGGAKFRLQRLSIPKEEPQLGAYIHDLRTRINRSATGEFSPPDVIGSASCRRKPAGLGALSMDSFFPCELG